MPEGLDLHHLGQRVLEQADGARKALRLYPPEHPLVTEILRHLEFVLGDLFLGFSEITLSVLDREFYLNDLPLRRESTSFVALAEHLEARAATSLTLTADVNAQDLRQLFAALEMPIDELQTHGGLSRLVEMRTQHRIRVARARLATGAEPSHEARELPEELKRRLNEARQGYEAAVNSVQTVFQNIAADGQIDYRTIKLTTEALLDSVVTNRNVWPHLLNVKHTDEYSYNHSVNVAALALLLATRFGIQQEALSVLGEAALLHDLGKQKVPAEILQKPAALTDEEWAEMRSHPEKGAKILLGVRDVSDAAIMVAYEHHIRYDLKGYPRTRQPRKLHLFSHLVAVADIYDALTSDRGYRRALMPDMAMRIILTQSGTAFHPMVVKHFVNLVGIHPVGTFVRLRTGEVALVQHNQSRDLLRPLVLVVYGADGRALRPVVRDLIEDSPDEPPIEGCIDPVDYGIDPIACA